MIMIMKKNAPKTAKQRIKNNTMKNLAMNILIFAVLLGATFWFVFKDQDMGEIVNVLKSADLWFVLLGVLLMLMYFMTEAWNVKSILKSFGEKIGLLKALKFTLINFFFCAVSPGASGGQPMEIYYMTKEGISGSHATLAILIQTCGIQFAVMVLGVVCLLFSPVQLSGVVLTLYLIGLAINGAAFLILLLCIFSNKSIKRLVNFMIKLIKKVGFKKIDAQKDKLNKGLDDYAKSSVYIKAHMGQFMTSMMRGVLQMSCYYLITFCVYKAFGLSGQKVWELFAMQSILFMATSGLPIPGAIGASESVFLSLYGAAFGASILSSAMLLSRGINFYWFVIISLVVVFINGMRKRNVDGEIDKDIRELDS